MDLDFISNVYAQLGFFGLFSTSGWAVAYLLYKENKMLMVKYTDLMERVLAQNLEIKVALEKLADGFNVESLLKSYLGVK